MSLPPRPVPGSGPRNSSTTLLMSRLQREIKEIAQEPLPGIQVFFDHKDITLMCLVLTPSHGPFSGLRLHLSVSIPLRYPHDPPCLSIQTPVPHPNVFGSYICCDLLQLHERSSAAYNGGYTPGYLLKYLFLQILTFFSAYKVEQSYGWHEYVYMGQKQVSSVVTSFVCEKCGFNRTIDSLVGQTEACSLTETTPEESLSASTSDEVDQVCVLDHLSADCWLCIFDFLSDQDIICLSRASPSSAGRIASEYSIVLRRQLVCFFLRKTFRESVLGVGVRAERRGRKQEFNIEAFDLLSFEAFTEHRVREGVWGDTFTHFLPLALDGEHFSRALPILCTNLTDMQIDCGVGAFKSVPFLGIIPKLMNQMIVNVMKVCDKENDHHGDHDRTVLRASEKALQGYCLLLHLLIELADQYPEVREEAQKKFCMFMQKPCNRHKMAIPDMGEFLAFLPLIVDDCIDWPAFCSCFVEEMLARNVFWFLKERPYLAYLEPESYVSVFRLTETFKASRTSLRLMMFQARFLQLVIKSKEQLSRRYGYPMEKMGEYLFKLRREVYSVEAGHDGSGWRVFFKILRYPLLEDNQNDGNVSTRRWEGATRRWQGEVTKILRRAVEESEKKGYHQSVYDLDRLHRIRTAVEPSCPPPASCRNSPAPASWRNSRPIQQDGCVTPIPPPIQQNAWVTPRPTPIPPPIQQNAPRPATPIPPPIQQNAPRPTPIPPPIQQNQRFTPTPSNPSQFNRAPARKAPQQQKERGIRDRPQGSRLNQGSRYSTGLGDLADEDPHEWLRKDHEKVILILR